MITLNEMLDKIKAVTLPSLKKNGTLSGHTRLMMSSTTKTWLEYHLDSQNFNPKPVSTIYGFNVSIDDRLADNEFQVIEVEPVLTPIPFDES